MMRFVTLALCLVGCSPGAAVPDPATGSYAGEGRNRLCIAGEVDTLRAGVIVYGAGDTNCSASGRLERGATGWALVPRGEGDCRIPIEMTGDAVRIGQPPAACSYYCGPGVVLARQAFSREAAATPVVDLAGDTLC